jgi:ORF6N domain
MSNEMPLQVDQIGSLIRTIRGQKVMLDSDLARIYGVTTKRLNEQVKRNFNRFPPDFLFQLTDDEFESLSPHTNATFGFFPTPSPKMARSWRRTCSTARRPCG